MRRSGIVFLLTIMIGVGLAPIAQARPMNAGRYIVVLKPGNDARSVARSHEPLGVRASLYFRSALRGYAASIPSAKLALLRRDPRVASIRRDRPVRMAAQTIPAGVKRIGATKVGTGSGIHVAVLDTGIDTTHPELSASIVGGKNCTTRPSFQDEHGHGTHVAGIIAAANNSEGVRGVATGAKLWSVRVLDHKGDGFESWIVCGLDFVDGKSPANGGTIRIANMSLVADGGDDRNCGLDDGDALHQAVCRVSSHGVTVIAAAGNENRDIRLVSPASYDEVLTVSALADSDGAPCGFGPATWAGADDTFASFSNFAMLASDKAHMIGAPGVDILSTDVGGGYAEMDGTSMATPHVSGIAARFLASHPGASPADVKAALRGGGEPLNVAGGCVGGLGVLHADPSGKHAEPIVLAPSIVSVWSRYPSTLVAATGNPHTHGR